MSFHLIIPLPPNYTVGLYSNIIYSLTIHLNCIIAFMKNTITTAEQVNYYKRGNIQIYI